MYIVYVVLDINLYIHVLFQRKSNSLRNFILYYFKQQFILPSVGSIKNDINFYSGFIFSSSFSFSSKRSYIDS